MNLVIQGVTLQNGRQGGGTADNGGSIVTSGNVTITDSRLTSNVATGSGGAIQITNAGAGRVVITGSTLDNNLAGVLGGAIRTELGTALTIQNSTLSANSVVGGAASGDGGAISIRTSSLGNIALTSVTVTGNSASRRGGGISYDSTSFAGGTQAIRNTIMSGNTATSSNATVNGTMGIAVSLGGVSVVVAGPLTVNQVVTESGGGNITLTSTDDAAAPELDTLTINANVSATGGNGNISLNGENVTVGTGATTPTVSTLGLGTLHVTAASATSLGANSNLVTAGATLTITTDDIAIDAGATPASVNAGAGIVTIRNNSNDRLIDLGTNTANRLSLTDAELDRVTASSLRIGRSDANDPGSVLVSSTITLVPTTLHILSGDFIQQTVGANVVVSNLALTTSSTVSLGNAGNVVDTVAISSGEDVTFRNSQVTGLSVGTVDGLTGVSGQVRSACENHSAR